MMPLFAILSKIVWLVPVKFLTHKSSIIAPQRRKSLPVARPRPSDVGVG